MMRPLCITLLMLAAALAAGPADAQESPADSAAVDSTTSTAPADSAISPDPNAPRTDSTTEETAPRPGMQSAIDRWVKPKWKTTYRAGESRYELGTGMTLQYLLGGGWSAGSNIDLKKRKYRGRDMSDINQTFNNSASKIVPDRYSFSIALGQNYLRQKAIGLSRSGGDMVIEDKYARSSISWERPELWANNSRFTLQAGAGSGQNDFKYNNNFEIKASGYLWYRLSDDLDIEGGYGAWRKLEDSDVSGRKFENMPSDMDTVRAGLSYGSNAQKLLLVSYDRSVGVVRKVDPPRGNSLQVIENPELATMEQSTRKNEKVLVKSRIKPLSFVSLDFTFHRNYIDQQNLVDERLSRETDNRKIEGKVIYSYSTNGRLDLQLERMENDVDYGTVSLSSYIEKERKLRMSITHDITDSLRVTAMGSGSLKQRFFKKKDVNPRDADFLYYTLFADLDAGLPHKISAGVQFTYRNYQTINIDRSLSGDNRIDYTYWVVPRFRLKPALWFEIGQEYEIKMEFTDFTFYENKNYLDRTTIMSTDALFRIFRTIKLSVNHRYLFTDTGSYLRPESGGERLYGRVNENFENRLSFIFEYKPSNDFSIFSRSNYRFQESNRLGFEDGSQVVTGTRYYNSGEFRLGFQRKKRVTASGLVDLDVAWVRRFGPNLTPERREFWEVDLNVDIEF